MPNWKKLITSGSDAALNSLNVTSEFTASGLNYPTLDGTDGQVLLTDGSGVLTFGDNVKYVTVKNVSSGTLTKGTPVHSTGTSGNTPEVIAASASLASAMPANFVLAQNISAGAEGRAVLSGFLNGVDTNGFDAGSVIYVAPTGSYTNTKPEGDGNLIQNVAIVGSVGVNGSLFVYGSGRSNDVPNLPEGKIWVGSSNYTVTSSVAHLDESNGRLGIGTNSPTQKLDVRGNILISGSSNALFIKGDGSKQAKFSHDGAGLTIEPITQNQDLSLGSTTCRFPSGIKHYGGAHIFYTGSASGEAARIDKETGYLGIGTSSLDEALTVVGNVSASGDLYAQGGQVFLGGAVYALEQVSGNYGIRNSSGNYGGNDGSGAYSTPQDFLHIPGTARFGPKYSTSDRDYIKIIPSGVTSSLETRNEKFLIENTQPSGDANIELSVGTGNLFITGSGNVGIGTNNPSEALSVEGNTCTSGLTTTNTLTVTGLSNQGSEATALMINGSNVVGTRELGSNAFSSTTFVDTSGTPVDNQVAIFTDADTIEGSSNLTFDGTNLTVGGKLTATEIVTNVVSQSISFATGSNRFGDEISDTHTFTGSLNVTGSLGVTGNLTISAGHIETDQIYLADKILHSGDSDTYIAFENNTHRYFAAGEEMIKFNSSLITLNEAGGNNDIRIKGNSDTNLFYSDGSADKIGIGTITPDEKLTVEGNISASGNFIGADITGSSLNLSSVVNAGTDTDKFLVLDSDGNVDFRTGANVLSDIGATTCTGTVTGTGAVNKLAIWNSSTALTSDTCLHWDTSNDRLGIGTITPTQKLHISGSATDVGIRIDNSATNGRDWFLYSRAASGVKFSIYDFDASADRLGIDENGNVGIGTITPTQKLTVEGNISGSGCIQIGTGHTLSGTKSSIGGGINHTITGNCSFIGGGCDNCITGNCSFVGGGRLNDVLSTCSVIAGGYDNSLSATVTAIAGGRNNCITSTGACSFIGGGYINKVQCLFSTIGGGCSNCIQDAYSFIGGGIDNCTNSSYWHNVIGGGSNNTISGTYSGYHFIGGGQNNSLSGTYVCHTTIAGGYANCITGDSGTIGGGAANDVYGRSGTIAGGSTNMICSGEQYATIGGGRNNTVDGDCSTIAGGAYNCITANAAIIAGGTKNTGSAACSGILGGKNNYVNHANSFIVGSDLTSDKACYTFMNNLVVEGTVSGSVFSGSFVGDGSGLTGISGGGGAYSPYITGSVSTGILPTATSANNCTTIGAFTTIAGGTNNTGSAACSFIGGGCLNYTVSNKTFATIGGGQSNRINSNYSSILGGRLNNINSGNCSFIGGGCGNTLSGYYLNTIVGGKGNTVSNYATCQTIVGGVTNTITGGGAGIIGAGQQNTIGTGNSNGAIVAGHCNTLASSYNAISNLIGSGCCNSISSAYPQYSHFNFIGSGCRNKIFNGTNSSGYGCVQVFSSAIVAGTLNTASAACTFIGGGCGNTVTDELSVIGGGKANCVTSGSSVIGGGCDNCISGIYDFIGGGISNCICNAKCSSIVGGDRNVISGSNSSRYHFIGGGLVNKICIPAGGVNGDSVGFIGGGYNNHVTIGAGVIVGGTSNSNSGYEGFIGAGNANTVSGCYSSVVAGRFNCVTGCCSAVVNGCRNCITSEFAFIGGGKQNTGSGDCSTIAGGCGNTASGGLSTVGGGKGNTASGYGSGVFAGLSNTAGGTYGAVLSGLGNNASSAFYSVIAGGCCNSTPGANGYAFIGAGQLNTDYGYNGAIVSGRQNNIGSFGGYYNFIGAGFCNTIAINGFGCNSNFIGAGSNNLVSITCCASIVGGNSNTITSTITPCANVSCNAAIVGGQSNCINHSCFAFIGGGSANCIYISNSATIAGGCLNRITAGYGAVGGGTSNCITNTYGVIAGGYINCVTGACSGILGGYSNCVVHSHSFAIGCNLTSTAACYTFMNNACVSGTTRTTTLVETSAKKYKECILPLEDQIENIKKLEPVEFQWKKDKTKDIGFIAEDVKEVYPNLIAYEEDGEINGIQYSKLTTVLVKALQQQQKEIDNLTKKVDTLTSKLDSLQK